jgi:hypothetical protein
MPRKKYPKPKPLESFPLGAGILSIYTVEIWDNFADSGERGSWKKRKACDALNVLIQAYESKLLSPYNPPNVSDIALRRLLGNRQTSKLIDEIKPILKKNNLTLQKTALWMVAKDLQNTFKALKNAIVNNQNNLGHLPVNSPEYLLRQKILKGTF